MGKVFLCFLFFVFDQYFSGSKAHKGASPDRFSLCTSCILAQQYGAKVGGYCWLDVQKCEHIREEHKAYMNEHNGRNEG